MDYSAKPLSLLLFPFVTNPQPVSDDVVLTRLGRTTAFAAQELWHPRTRRTPVPLPQEMP